MDFVDDLGLIDRDIRLFRENKHKFWMQKMTKDNSRMFVNSQLKGVSSSFDTENMNPVKYDPMNTTEHGPQERELLLVSTPKSIPIIIPLYINPCKNKLLTKRKQNS